MLCDSKWRDFNSRSGSTRFLNPANWDFSDEIQATLNPEEDEAARPDSQATFVDIVVAAKASLCEGGAQVSETPATKRLQLTDEMMPEIIELFQLRLDSLASAVR